MHKKLIIVVICFTLLPGLLQASQNLSIPMIMKNHFTSSHDLPEYFKQAGLTDEAYKQYVNEIVDKQYADVIDDENFDIGNEIDAIHHKVIDYISPLVRENFEPKLHAVLFDILNNPSKNIEKINEYTYHVSSDDQAFSDKQADEILNDAVLHRKLNFQIYPVLEFMISTEKYKPSVMQFILDNFTITQKVTGVDRVDLFDFWKKTPLMEACQDAQEQGLLLRVKFLIHCKANPNAKDLNNWTPLIFACYNQGPQAFDIVQYLVEKGVDINFQNKYGETALMSACQNQGPQAFNIVQYLVGKGADLNLQSKSGKTALMRACANRGSHAFNMVKYLLDCGADKNVRNQSGRTALNFSRTQEMRDFLNNYQPKVS